MTKDGKTLSSLAPLGRGQTLARETGLRIAADIAAGRIAPGARLPTEQALMEAMGVSRTVIREAVAALRAEGLVDTRQGIGSFVVAASSQAPFRLAPEDTAQVMELRVAVETEAAGLAAERATAAQKRAIGRALIAIDQAAARGHPAVEEDFAFHAAITEATGNPQFRRFLDFLGHIIIPRASFRLRARGSRAYLMAFQDEHRAIAAAIQAGGSDEARAAMRAHLIQSQKRFQTLTLQEV